MGIIVTVRSAFRHQSVIYFHRHYTSERLVKYVYAKYVVRRTIVRYIYQPSRNHCHKTTNSRAKSARVRISEVSISRAVKFTDTREIKIYVSREFVNLMTLELFVNLTTRGSVNFVIKSRVYYLKFYFQYI